MKTESPFFLMFGRTAHLPIDVIYDTPTDVSTLPEGFSLLCHTLAHDIITVHDVLAHFSCRLIPLQLS